MLCVTGVYFTVILACVVFVFFSLKLPQVQMQTQEPNEFKGMWDCIKTVSHQNLVSETTKPNLN